MHPSTVAGALPSLDDGGKEPFKQIRCVCHSHRMRQSLFYETTLCKFFEKGKCSRGNNCNFAHGRRRLRDKPDLAKTKWCAAFLESGSCPLGAQECPYAHDRDEKRKYRGKHVVSVDQTAELYISDTSDVLAESIRTEQPDSSVAAGSNFTDAPASTRHMPDCDESDASAEVAPPSPSRRSEFDEEDVPCGGPVLDVAVRNTFLHFQEQSERSGRRRSASWSEGASGTAEAQKRTAPSGSDGSDQEAVALQLSSLEVRSFAG